MRRLLFFVFSVSLLTASFSQDDETGYEYRKPFAERIFIGGNVAFSFSNTSSFINVSPYVGYRITDEFSVGPGLVYQYSSYRNRINNTRTSYSIYGGNFFARYVFMEYVVIQASYELLSYPTALNDIAGNLEDRDTESYLYLGGGLQYPLSDNFWLSILVSYDVLDDRTKFNPHGRNPVYFVGFNLGL